MALLLGHWGFEAIAVHTGPEALQAAHAFSRDLILLDIGMPGMNGFEVARRLRELFCPNGKEPVLVAFSGYGDEQTRQLSLDAGIDLHVVKPVEMAELEKLLRRLQSAIASRTE
jgi:CheY-like chemotaxis protein